MTELLSNNQETKTISERGQRFKRALGMAAVKLTATVAMVSALVTVGSRHESQDEQNQLAKANQQQYVLVDNVYDDYNSIANPLEQSWCRWPSRWSLCNMALRDMGGEALASAEYVAQTYDWTDHNGKADAFRHCFWSGLMTRQMGYDTAKGFGDRHEYGAAEPEDERNMDLTNNEIGRQVGLGQGSIYNPCVQYAQNGVLVSLQK